MLALAIISDPLETFIISSRLFSNAGPITRQMHGSEWYANLVLVIEKRGITVKGLRRKVFVVLAATVALTWATAGVVAWEYIIMVMVVVYLAGVVVTTRVCMVEWVFCLISGGVFRDQ